MHIHERENWFNFGWDNEKILPILTAVRHLQGRLPGHMENGFVHRYRPEKAESAWDE